MKNQKLISALLGLVLVVIIAVVAYVVHDHVLAPVTSTPISETGAITASSTATQTTHHVTWRLTDAGMGENSDPHVRVEVTVDEKTTYVNTYQGDCHELGKDGGIDGSGFLPGEISAVQCWWAGGGDEIGVFTSGTSTVIKHGELDEGTSNSPFFRGNFK
jgi:hypothetical protein